MQVTQYNNTLPNLNAWMEGSLKVITYLYHGVWADQRVLSWYALLQYTTVAGSYTMVAKGVNAR